jgi:S-DNA-T family DNA segregation ATPase FtsK/SpoIIIE
MPSFASSLTWGRLTYSQFNKKVGRVKKNYFRFDHDFLCIHTESGEFKFKIENDTSLNKAKQIAELMVDEMDKVEQKFQRLRKQSSPYAKLLLTNLNMADKYVRIQRKYNQLLSEREKLIAGALSTKGLVHPKREPAKEPPQPPAAPPQDAPSIPPSTAPAVASAESVPAKKTERKIKPIEPTQAIATLLPALPAKPAPETVEIKKIASRPEALPVPTDTDRETETETQSVEKTWGAAQSRPVLTIKPSSPPPLRIKTQDPSASVGTEANADSCEDFELPYLDFLRKADETVVLDHDAIRRDAEILEQKLGYFGIKGEVMEVSPGPVITTFEYKPAPGIKISKIVNLADDLALALSAISIRIVAPIPGKDVIGIEIPNPKMSIVPFFDIVSSEDFVNINSPTPICLGKDIIGNPVVVGLEKMPHLLIAGATGTGKSVALNAMIASILYKSPPDRVKFIMIDPKRIELSLFNDIPHLLTPVIVDMRKANIALQWVVREMERRYENLAALQVRNIDQYNNKVRNVHRYPFKDADAFEPFPYIVVIIDELADLMMTASKDIEFSLTRIAQMARAAGIHLILATQRPSVDVLTGIIKANFPTRISFQVSSKTDSRTIIDSNGAETLLGRGDMLFVPPGTARLTRVHGTYLSEEELLSITNFLKSQGKPEYVLEVISEKEDEVETMEVSEDEYDEKYQAALEFVLSSRQASISSVQRALRVGYNRAARIIDLMEQKGIVSPADGIKPRQVLVDRRECLPY